MRKIAANPGDHQTRFDFAILLNPQNRREEAAAELVEIIKRDRAWKDDGTRKQLLQFFDASGAVDPPTIAARRKLSTLLFLEGVHTRGSCATCLSMRNLSTLIARELSWREGGSSAAIDDTLSRTLQASGTVRPAPPTMRQPALP